MRLLQECSNAGDVRCRHRSAGQKGKIFTRHGIRGIRREARKNIDAGCCDVGFQNVLHRCRPARGKRTHDIARVTDSQEKTLVQDNVHDLAGIDFIENQVSVGLPNHQGRNISDARRPRHHDGVTRDVKHDDGDSTCVFSIADFNIEAAAAALNERDVATDIRAVLQAFAAIERSATGAVGQGVVAVIDKHKPGLQRIAIEQRGRETGFLNRVFPGDRCRRINLHRLNRMITIATGGGSRDDPG